MPAIASFWEATIRAAFTELMPPGHRLPTAADAEPRLYEGLERPGGQIVVAERSGRLVGYSGFGASRDADAGEHTGELRSLFVVPDEWRSGAGTALVRRVLAELPAMGFGEVTVWSFADNTRANAFYERHGFRPDGARKREDVWAGILEVRLRRPLDRSS